MQSGNLPSYAPKHTLGHHIIWWCETNVNQSDGDRAGERIRLTDEQKHFILWFYAVDENGKWLYRTATLRRAKGSGKSPFMALLAIIEFLGPCRFWRFYKGQALGKRVAVPLIQVAAVAIHQTSNVLDAVRGSLVGSPLAADLDIGKGIIQFKDGRPGKIEPVTSNSATLEGGRPTFAVIDESHHMTESNGGVKMAQVIDRNIRKNPGGLARYLEGTNAYNPNQSSVAQRTHEAVLNGASSILYDCVEAPEIEDLEWDIKSRDNREELMKLLAEAYADAVWVDLDSIAEAIFDPRTPVSDCYRFYLNQIRESIDTWLPKSEWEAIYDEGTPKPSTNKKYQTQISIGFDGSLYWDSTAMIGCEISSGKLFVLGLWERPEDAPDNWSVPTFEVENRMQWAQENYDVVWVYADPSYWHNVLDRWALDYKWGKDEKDMVFPLPPSRTREMVGAVQRFRVAVNLKDNICHDGNEDLQRHILNAYRRETPHGDLIQKEHAHSKKRKDAADAAILAYEARADALADGRLKPKRRNRMASY